MVRKTGENSAVQKYQEVIFYDKDNKKEIKKLIPVGARIKTTNDVYEVKVGGLYIERENGKKSEKVDKLEVPLPHMKALEVFDVNQDGKIDFTDIEKMEAIQKKYDGFPVADRINEKLAQSGSKYHVQSVWNPYEDGGISEANISKDSGFGVTFRPNDNPKTAEREDWDASKFKEFGIKLPKQK